MLRTILTLYYGDKTFLAIHILESDSLDGKVDIRQGCLMSPMLCTISIDGVLQEVREKVYDICVKYLIFADDITPLKNKGDKLQELVTEFESFYKSQKLKVNVSIGKIIRIYVGIMRKEQCMLVWMVEEWKLPIIISN